MDKSERSSKEQFDLNKLSGEANDDHEEHHIDHNVDDNILESARVNEELGSTNEPEAVNDDTDSGGLFGNNDSVEQNPNVVCGVNAIGSSNRETVSYPRNGFGQSIEEIIPVLNSVSSSNGMISYPRNVLSQSIEEIRPVLNSVSASNRTISYLRNVLGQSIEEIRPVLNSVSSSNGMVSYPRNVLGQNIDGTMSLNRNIEVRPHLHTPRAVQVRVSTYRAYSHTPTLHPNRTRSSIQFLRAMNIPPHLNSSFFIPRGFHEHNMRIRSRPGYVITHGPLMAQIVPPIIEIRLPMVQMVPPMVVQMVPPMAEMRPLMVQMVPPMIEMRSPVVQMDSYRGFVCDQTRPSGNINMVVRSGGVRNLETSNSDEATSQDRR